MAEQLWNEDQSTSFNGQRTDYNGPSILLSDNEDFTDITQLLNSDLEGSSKNEPGKYTNYTVTICNNKVGLKILAVTTLVFTFFLVICFLVYREALATQRAMEFQTDNAENVDTLDMIMDYTE
eukprot:GFUD01038721.1.p1 GENE.GFUD01038721.1~~GFUD01038721.1.p1  ORF type:complete len:123 (-),score=16.26 GFUD01038721.1:48-416(-)